MIASGEKTEEYREIKPHWIKRLHIRKYDVISFRNGYKKDSPKMTIELLGIRSGAGLTHWGAPSNSDVYILQLGKILTNNKELL